MFKIDRNLARKISKNTSLAKVEAYNINGKNYYIKADNELKEIIGYRLAKLLDVNCVQYKSVVINGFNYSYSRDISELGTFIALDEIVESNHDLNYIINDIMRYSKNKTNLIIEILKMYIYDILFLNDDRHPSNWALIEENGELKTIIFDNQNIFSVIYPPFIRFNQDLFLTGNLNFFMSKLYKDLEQFLDYCPSEYKEYICNMILKAEVENVANIFKDIETQYNKSLNPIFLKIYKEHYENIEEIVNRKRGVNNAR